MPGGTPADACTLSSTYIARWSWDVTIYLAYASIEVYRDGDLAGRALYDSRGGRVNPGKFIDAEPKIRELVSELFPERAAGPATRRSEADSENPVSRSEP